MVPTTVARQIRGDYSVGLLIGRLISRGRAGAARGHHQLLTTDHGRGTGKGLLLFLAFLDGLLGLFLGWHSYHPLSVDPGRTGHVIFPRGSQRLRSAKTNTEIS